MPTLAGKQVGATGYGLMGLTWRPNPCPTDQAFAAMRAALTNGANFWNGGEFYGPHQRNSLVVLNQYFKKYPEDAAKVVISIKGGMQNMVPNGKPAFVRKSVEESLRQLGGTAAIDLYQCARVDRGTPIEETMGELNRLKAEGKIGGIGLSEVNADTIRRAARVARIDAVEVELSLWQTHVLDNGTAAACAELGIALVAYSPLGRGFLTGRLRRREDIPAGSTMHNFPRFQGGNFDKNVELLDMVDRIAHRKGATHAQLALAWLRALSGRPGMPVIIPIPGATTVERVNENTKEITLDEEDMKEIDAVLKSFTVSGDRYPAAGMAHADL